MATEIQENVFNFDFTSAEEAKEFFEQVETFKKNLCKDYAEFNAREKRQNTIQKVKELLKKCHNFDTDEDDFFSKKFVLACELFDCLILGDGLGLILEHPEFRMTVINKLQESIIVCNIKGNIEYMNILIKYYDTLYFLLESKVSFAPFFC